MIRSQCYSKREERNIDTIVYNYRAILSYTPICSCNILHVCETYHYHEQTLLLQHYSKFERRISEIIANSGRVWYLIVSIPDFCTLTYFKSRTQWIQRMRYIYELLLSIKYVLGASKKRLSLRRFLYIPPYNSNCSASSIYCTGVIKIYCLFCF